MQARATQSQLEELPIAPFSNINFYCRSFSGFLRLISLIRKPLRGPIRVYYHYESSVLVLHLRRESHGAWMLLAIGSK